MSSQIPALVYVTERATHPTRVYVWVHPPAIRTVLINKTLRRLSFPWMTFLEARMYSRSKRHPTRLTWKKMYPLVSRTRPQTSSSSLLLTPLPNIVHYGGVCFGEDNAEMMRAPSLVDLYWNSEFTMGPSEHNAFYESIRPIAEWEEMSRDFPDEWPHYPWEQWQESTHGEDIVDAMIQTGAASICVRTIVNSWWDVDGTLRSARHEGLRAHAPLRYPDP